MLYVWRYMEPAQRYTHNGAVRDLDGLRWQHPIDLIEPEESDAANYVRRLLFWITDGRTIVQVGQRALAMTYVIDPSVIGGATLDAIGGQSGVTRQGIDKYVTDFRDTFPGLKNRVMRDDETRENCKKAQHARYSKSNR